MMSQRLLMRGLPRAGQLARPSVLRAVMQPRFSSSDKAVVAQQEALLAEKARLEAQPRKMVEIPADGHPELVGAQDNAFNRERAAIRLHAVQSSALWRKLMWYVALPCIVLSGVNAWILWNEHWYHFEHSTPLSERPQYSYLNIRTKKFPWGDGNYTLFYRTIYADDPHNPKTKYVPDDKLQ